ncbi:hypothetical protein, partial [Escherichia coli]
MKRHVRKSIKRFRPLSTEHPAPQKEVSKDDVMHIRIILLPVMQICIIVGTVAKLAMRQPFVLFKGL